MFNQNFSENLLINQKKNLHRYRCLIENREQTVAIIAGKNVINFCSNDYLNLSMHPLVKKALAKGAFQYGLGSSASHLVSGYLKPHQQLEEAFAEILNRERALLFNSGYQANLGVISTLLSRNNLIISDKYCHASLIDGIILSRAKHLRYAHQDLNQAENLLKNNLHKKTFLVTESIFSMEGTLTDISEIIALSKIYNNYLILDDAHGFGVLPAYYSAKEVPCLITPLGKAAGSMGAIVSGSHDLIENLLQFSRLYRYTTALPPAICYATLAALNIIKKENWRREKLHELAKFFNQEAIKRELPLTAYNLSPIKCILVSSNQKTMLIKNKLFQQGFFVSGIRPPTVPFNKARIRISLNCLHHKKHIIALLDQMYELINL